MVSRGTRGERAQHSLHLSSASNTEREDDERLRGQTWLLPVVGRLEEDWGAGGHLLRSGD